MVCGKITVVDRGGRIALCWNHLYLGKDKRVATWLRKQAKTTQ